MYRTVFPRLGVLCACLFFLAACGGSRTAPTPTPTKTPTQNTPQALALPTPTPVPTDTPAPIDLPTPTARPENSAPYTGLPVDDIEPLRRRPIFICINNDPVGRSAHHGLSQADLVYEYIVDGFSMTRLTAMYQSKAVERIGPVRSARMPNIWMTYMYDGVLACSGGSDEIRYLLKNEVGFPYLDADIDDPSNNVYFFSIGSDYRTRMQVSTAGVRRWLQNTNREKEWQRPGFEFSPDPPANATGDATTIRITYPGGNSVEWRYDPSLDGYIRFQAGTQQIDLGNSRPIVAQNVVVMTAHHELTDMVEDSLGTKGVNIELYGFGDLRVFRDGKVYEGTWRADPETPPRWLGPGEVIIDLKPGQSWVQVIQQLTDMTYQ
ncbi:MAG: hypothetical protein DCC55_15810 [Chloroflexi bacterium]|nr:MAG: hypothetical protein DCC55_15810 [Chloroflexota bacterium]